MTSSDQARALLLRDVDSFDKLQALLLLAKEPAREWTVRELSQQLALDHALVVAALDALGDSGLVRAHASEPVTFRFEPGSPELAQAVEALVALHHQDCFWVMNVITRRAIDRLRGATAAYFSGMRSRKAIADDED
jgi:hypothetical protein